MIQIYKASNTNYDYNGDATLNPTSCIIKHEIKGRMRVHLLQNRMTFGQADTLLYYLSSQKLVTGVKVREKNTGCHD